MAFDALKLKLERLTKCPICGCENIPVKVSMYWFRLLIHYCQCGECGTLFLNPRMSDKQTSRYYQGAYRERTSKGNFLGDKHWEELRAKTQLPLIKPYLTGIRTNLEIGSSTGRLMEALSKLHIHSVGIEPEVRYRQAEPSAQFESYSDIAEVEAKPFDLICSSHTIEHLNHPLEYYENLVRNFSHKKTIFMVETPNTAIYRCLGLEHPFAFTESSLDGLFARIGLKPMRHFYHNLNRSSSQKYLLALYEKGK